MSANYAAVRDDSGIRSISLNERDFLRSGALGSNILRVDGRRGDELRKVRLHLGRWDNGAESTVQWGVGTRVTSLCTADLVPPSLDRPNEGIVNFTVDLSPMASTSFRQAPSLSTASGAASTMPVSRGPNFSNMNQRLLSNRILRSIERIVLIGGALDTEALVLIPGKWVWRFNVALTILDDGGNIIDACVLATTAALRHYRKPHVDMSASMEQEASMHNSLTLPTMISSTVKEATPLPLHHTPLSISYALIPSDPSASTSNVAALLDPTEREELVQYGSLSIGMNIHSEVCLLDYGGGCELPPMKLKECFVAATVAVKDLCGQLEQSLKEADEQAQKERLQLLREHRSWQPEDGQKLMLPPLVDSNSPYIQRSHAGDDELVKAVDSEVDIKEIDQAKSEAEEAYRKQALDYSTGHIASAVKEDKNSRGGNRNNGGSLLASLLKAAVRDTPSRVSAEKPLIDSKDGMKSLKDEVRHDLETAGSSVEDKNELAPVGKCEGGQSAMETHDSGDEEETITLLNSEFQSVSTNKSALESETEEKATPSSNQSVTKDLEDLDDFAMAIKKKKKKKGKKK